MIISIVSDPRIFSSQVVTDEFTKREVIGFLQAVNESGVLLDDPDRSLLHEAVQYAQELTTGLGQRILLLLQELMTKAKKFVVSLGSRINEQLYRSAPERELARLAVAMKADAIVASKSHSGGFGTLSPKQVAFGAVPVEDWSVHRLESHRKQLLNPETPFDQLEPAAREERIGRALKYATKITFLDPLLVASPKHSDKYLEGISFFVSLWEKWTWQPGIKLTVDIYTVGEKQTQNGYLTGGEAVARLEKSILDPLRRSGKCVATGFVKRDSEPSTFHARFIRSKLRAYSLDPGFDSFDKTGPIRRCFFRLESTGERHVDDCIKLKDAS